MARTWLSVTVELLGGRGEELWPWPGRVFAVGPSHTFEDLANAVNDAFARWDRAHLSMFTLADGRVVTDAQTRAEMAESIGGPITETMDIASAKVARLLKPGAEFQFTFDLGDNWTHRCEVGKQKIDPVQEVGVLPEVPLPYWGWGTIPDQYGRRWADDDGESRPPRRPSRPHPMLLHTWPAREQVPTPDLAELRAAIASADAARFLAAVRGHDVDDALHQVGAGIPMALAWRPQEVEPVALSVINRLTWRAGPGDEVLAEDLLACLRGEPLPGRVLPVDLEMLSAVLEGDPGLSTGGYVDLRTGEVYDEDSTDPMTVGQDAAVDIDAEPDRWLRFDRTDSRDGWRDMAAFAERQHDAALRERLARAIEGRGAFGRFRDLVHQEGLADQWDAFSTDRRLGRARQFLADEGIRVV
ncbi:IS1096 element passenger TnpR family protein [Rhodococcus ruber]|uniref:IS1096 element passenger TnpR family protein n=1 Tax=Rhodococcus ruber TaxID=1830 RepID=UPI00315CD41E